MVSMGPSIGIILGSASDIDQARKISDLLKELNIRHEVTVASAHRTPDDVVDYASRAASRNIKVIIAVAGLSAALPGTVAANTLLPVIGVPVVSGSLGGLDALLSIAQMPPGVPVASVGINGGKNAALLAARIMAVHDEEIEKTLTDWLNESSQKTRSSRNSLDGLPVAPADAFGGRKG